ncbi:MAG: hypothetical protein RDV48_21455 [Candidatus Eremiobacteraeota bacterium]|nr:hypothetical protein [Candidatus Eremiobacteraeota bacterium]
MELPEVRQEIEAMLDQLPEEDLPSVKSFVESLLEKNEEGASSESPKEEVSKGGPDHPAVIALASEVQLEPETFLARLGEYERDLLSTYIETSDPGVLIKLRKTLGLPFFR